MKKQSTDRVEPIYINLGSRLRVLRLSQNIEKAHVASVIGISVSHVGGIEDGRSRFSLHYVEQFAALYGLTPEDLLKGMWV